jgi:5S rRNA maturation endonuclease (ribonuclease M5)
MKFYSFEDIKAAGSCIRYVTEIMGLEIRDGRCQAVWRGGDGFNVALTDEAYYDHKIKDGAGLLQLCADDKFNGDIQQSQQFLGNWLNLTPVIDGLKKGPMTSARYDELIAAGYTEAKRYGYSDLEGNLVHFVARFEHPEKHKEFMQGTPDHWGLKDVTPILYRMADWHASEWVCVVEGEKDVDTLIDQLGIPATTNCGGADKWRPEYATLFRKKKVVIIRDNDEAGEAHANRVARELKDQAELIKVICPSKLPKGDVTDWVQQESGTADALMDMIGKASNLDLTNLEPIDIMVEGAKAANKYDLRNFILEKRQIGNETKMVKVPRRLTDIIEDVHKRFIGFPRRVGDASAMFDHDRETGEIMSIHSASALFAWMQRKSGRKIEWERGSAFVEKSELFHGLHAEAQRYDAISHVPDWPKRSGVYYAHDPLPEPSPDHKYFNEFIDFFSPADAANRTLLKAFVCAPLWYVRGIPRPAFTIDSTEGAGCGKTTLVEMVADVYKSPPIKVNVKELKTKVEDITKRLVSTSGRLLRMLLVDNATGRLDSAELADMITAQSISGKAPYGRGEETRPNNITFCVTSNSAQLSNDLADRSIVINVKRPRRDPNWKGNLLAYVEKYRMHIIADMIDKLEKGPTLKKVPHTRFPEFEQTILRAVCYDDYEYEAAVATMNESKGNSNAEEDCAQIVEEGVRENLMKVAELRLNQNIFITSSIFNRWLKWISDSDLTSRVTMQDVRTFSKNGHTERLAHRPERLRLGNGSQPRGVLWAGDPTNPEVTCVIVKGSDGKPRAHFEAISLADAPKFTTDEIGTGPKPENETVPAVPPVPPENQTPETEIDEKPFG